MEHFEIRGGTPLSGSITISGAKNAALPACVASILTDSEISLAHIPQLRDVATILDTISSLGKRVERDRDTIRIIDTGVLREEAQARFVEQMRASFLVLGPLVARLGRAVVPLPGGCRIGTRPVDLHLYGLRQLGARVEELPRAVVVTADRLRGATIRLPFPSVGATEQILMTATLADGETLIENPSWEPEVMDLVELLRKMGGNIESDEGTLRITGVERLHAAEHAVIPDRMEAGTYLIAGAITRGTVTVRNVIPEHLRSLAGLFEKMGLDVDVAEGAITLSADGRPRPLNISTAPYPGIPTDLQPPLVSLLSLATGVSIVEERIFEHRFSYTDPLRAMGARIEVAERTAKIEGVETLRAVSASAPDIRGGAAIVLAALAANGTSTITNLDQIDRGYEDMATRLQTLGGRIERIT